MEPALFYQVIVPLLGVNNTALLAISTPQDELNYYTELMNLKNERGENLFHSIKLGLICNSCAKTGAACSHLLSMNPHWKSADRTMKCDAIMACDPAMRDRELRGVVSSSKRFLLNADQIESLRLRAAFIFGDGSPDVLYSAIDPSGGGAGSDYAIITLALVDACPVIVGIDRSGSSDPVVIQQMIDKHYITLRRHPQYKRCMIRVFIEANMSFIDAGRIANQLMSFEYGDMDVVAENKPGSQRFGIWTSKDTKEGYAIEIQRGVPIMRIADQPVGTSFSIDFKELLAQLAMFRREVITPTNNTGVALHYNLALTGKSPGRKDDLVMALGIALFYMFRSMNDELFMQRCAKKGLKPF